jgi:uncharacterized protein (DUF58 family)
MRSGSGRRHNLAVLRWLAEVEIPPDPLPPSVDMLRRQLDHNRGLRVVFSPLLTERSVALVAELARSGRPTLCIDTLPDYVTPPPRSHWTPFAERLWRLQRENTVMQLRELGVAVEPWTDAASLEAALRELTRRRYR